MKMLWLVTVLLESSILDHVNSGFTNTSTEEHLVVL